MPKDKSHKFNKATRSGGKEPFKNFPIKQFRFEVKHPIHSSTAKCSHRLGSMFSQQEELMVLGLSNILQCESRLAIRIAVYEACLANTAILKPYLVYAQATTKEQGHTSRNKKGTLSLPKEEKENFNQLIKNLSISEKEGLRLCIIWLAKGIRNETITRLTNCKRIDQLKLRQQWTKDNPEKASKPSTIQPLIKAQKEALNELEVMKDAKRELNNTLHKATKEFLRDNNGLSYNEARTLVELGLADDANDQFEKLIQEEADKQGLTSNEIEVFTYMSLGLTAEEAEAAVSQEHQEQLTEEEEELLLAEIDEMTKRWESDPKAKPGEVVNLRKKQRNKAPEFKPGEHKDLILKLEDKIENLEDRIEKGDTFREQSLKDNKKRLRNELSKYALTTYWDELYPNP